MELQKYGHRCTGSPLDDELCRYTRRIVEEQELSCLVDIISMYFDVWPFKDFSLKSWREVSDRLLEILSSIETKYFSGNVQTTGICDVDKATLLAIFKMFQRIFAYSRHKHSINISSQIISFIYSVDLEITIEAYKVLVFSFHHSMGLDEFLNDQDILFVCLEINADTLSTAKSFNLSEQINVSVPESSFEGEDVFAVLVGGTERYGKASFVFELRRRLFVDDARLRILKMLGVCAFMTLLKGGSAFDEIARRIDFSEIQSLMNDDITNDMEFAIMSLLEILVYEGFDFSEISQTLQLGDSGGIFYRRFAKKFDDYDFEGHSVFFIYNTLVSNQKSKYLKIELLMDKLLRFRECSPDVRYHLLHALRSHSKETNARGISEFVSGNGLEALFEYLGFVERYDFYEDANVRYAFKVLNEVYMRDGRHSMGVGNFEDSPFLDLTISTIQKVHLSNTRLVALCTGVLTCFMFDEPLNFPVFLEKGAGIVLDVFQTIDLTMEYVSVMISYMDAFSLNLGFQEEMLRGEYLLKLLLLCREEEFLGSDQGTNRMFSLLNMLAMHHPAFKRDILKFYDMNVRYLKNLFESEIQDPFRVGEYHVRVFDGFFNLVEQMQIYPDGDNVDGFFDDITDLVINSRYSYNMQNFFRGPFGEVYQHMYNELIIDKRKHFDGLVESTGKVVMSVREMLNNGVPKGFSWESDTPDDEEIEDLILSYDKQIALASLLCEEPVERIENGTKTRLFDAMTELFFVLMQFRGIFLPIADVSEHKFLSVYKNTRASLEGGVLKKDARMYVLQSIYLCNRFLLQRLYPTMLNISFDRTVGFTRELMEACFTNRERCSPDVCDSIVVLGLNFIDKLGLCFRTEHYEIVMREEFTRNFFSSDLRSERSKAVLSFFVSHLSGRLNEEAGLRYEFLRYLRDSEIEVAADVRDVELSNMVIEAIGGIFGDCVYKSSPKISDEEACMILDVYEKFYTSPLCMNLNVRRILRSSKYTMRLVRIKAFSSFQHFLKNDTRVYDHACFVLNRFFEYSDDFIDMAGHVCLFATVNMCFHKIDVVEINRKIPELIASDVSFPKILFFLTMYFRVLGLLDVPKPQTIDIEKLVSKIRTCDEMAQMMILFSYIMQPDMDAILRDVEFPSRRISVEDGQFLKSNNFLIYRDYNAFAKICLLRTDQRFANIEFRGGCHRIHAVRTKKEAENKESSVELSNRPARALLEGLVVLLRTAQYFDIAAQFLSEILFNHPVHLHELGRTEILETVYENYARKSESSERHKLLGEAQWAVAFFISGMYSEVALLKTGHSKEARDINNEDLEFSVFGRKTMRSQVFSPVSDFILEKIKHGTSEDFSNASFLLLRSLSPLFILKHEDEEDKTIERFKDVTVFMKAIGIFEVMIARINDLVERDSTHTTCIQHSLDYLFLVLKHCCGDVPQDIDKYGSVESGDVEYYSVASGEQGFEDEFFDSDESYFSNTPFYMESDSSIFLGNISDRESSRSENVVLIKTIENNYEISTTMHMLKSEYYSIPSEVRSEVENMLCGRFYSDFVGERSNLYDKFDEDCAEAPKNPCCELEKQRMPENCYSEGLSDDSEESECDEHDAERDTRGSTWGFNLTAGASPEHASSHSSNISGRSDDDSNSVTYPTGTADEDELENDEGPTESSVGSENGEMPAISPEVLNSMDEGELRDALKDFFNERRSLALTYVPLSVDFYSQLNAYTRSVFEEMERVYRESFFYDIRVENSVNNEEYDEVLIDMPEVNSNVFGRFLDESMNEKEFPFSKAWRLVDSLSRSTKIQDTMYERCDTLLVSIDKQGSRVVLDKHIAVVFRRCLCFLLSVARKPSSYERYFGKNPLLVSRVFSILERIELTDEILKLVASFSIIFQQDKDLMFKDVELGRICDCLSSITDSERSNLLEEFIENTATHFYKRFIEVILREIEHRFEVFSEYINGSSQLPSSSLADQKAFLRLWRMIMKILQKNDEVKDVDEGMMRLMCHPFWSVFFRFAENKGSIDELVNVSDIYEAFLIVGGISEKRFSRTHEDEHGKKQQWKEFKMFYEMVIESQSQQINVLVEEQPERFLKNFNGLIKHSILSFGNKKRYLNRKLRAEGVDRAASFYSVYVDRSDVLRSSYFQIMAKSPEEFKTKRLEVKITGEEGLDYGGLTREWFGLLVRDLLDPNFALFEFSSEEKTNVIPFKGSYVNPEHLSYFKFVGRVIAKAIMDGSFINLHLAKFVYKHILGKACNLEDVQSADPEFYNSLLWMRDNSIDASLRLTFSFDDTNLGVHKTVELVPNGADIFVNDLNKLEYIELATKYRLFHGIELQLSALKLGLFEILGEDTLDMFDENELELLICGVPEINVDDWKSNTLYYGYSENSKTVIWFWKAVRSFDSVHKAKLLQFATGTSTLPFEGFSHLQGNNEIQKFSIHKVSDKTDSLPTAHTCFNQLVLPEYSSYDSLLRCLTLAISECSTGFGFI